MNSYYNCPDCGYGIYVCFECNKQVLVDRQPFTCKEHDMFTGNKCCAPNEQLKRSEARLKDKTGACRDCEEWADGYGSDECLNCNKFDFVNQRQRSVKPFYYEPETLETMFRLEKLPNNLMPYLNEVEMTVWFQYKVMDMTQKQIADYHDINKQKCYRIIREIREKIKKYS